MPNLGTVYELNLKKKTKLFYPVVFKNDKYYVCKVPESSDVIVFHKARTDGLYYREENINVIPYSIFKEKYEKGKYIERTNRILVFVQKGEPKLFESLMKTTPEEKRLDSLEKIIDKTEYELYFATDKFNRLKNDIENATNELKALKREQENLREIVKKQKLETIKEN